MRITEVRVTYGETVRTGEFASRKCQLEALVSLDASDDAKRVMDTVMKRIRERVEAQLGINQPTSKSLMEKALEE